jgi:hypothetical protein
LSGAGPDTSDTPRTSQSASVRLNIVN